MHQKRSSKMRLYDHSLTFDDPQLLISNGYRISTKMLLLPLPGPDWTGNFEILHVDDLEIFELPKTLYVAWMQAQIESSHIL